MGKRSLPLLFVICADKMRFAKGGSRPSPTVRLVKWCDKLQFDSDRRVSYRAPSRLKIRDTVLNMIFRSIQRERSSM